MFCRPPTSTSVDTTFITIPTYYYPPAAATVNADAAKEKRNESKRKIPELCNGQFECIFCRTLGWFCEDVDAAGDEEP
jgi:hypothetical protein